MLVQLSGPQWRATGGNDLPPVVVPVRRRTQVVACEAPALVDLGRVTDSARIWQNSDLVLSLRFNRPQQVEASVESVLDEPDSLLACRVSVCAFSGSILCGARIQLLRKSKRRPLQFSFDDLSLAVSDSPYTHTHTHVYAVNGDTCTPRVSQTNSEPPLRKKTHQLFPSNSGLRASSI